MPLILFGGGGRREEKKRRCKPFPYKGSESEHCFSKGEGGEKGGGGGTDFQEL